MYPRSSYPVGGIFVHEQVQALRARGIDARVASGDPFWIQTINPRRAIPALRAYWSEASPWTSWDDVPVMHFPYLCGGLFRPTIHTLLYTHGLRRVLMGLYEEFPFQVVHAHTSFLDGAAGVMAARLFQCPLLITEHTGPFDLLTGNAFMRYRTRRSIVGADRTFAVSNSLRQAMLDELGLSPESIEVLPNGFDPSVFRPAPKDRPREDDSIRALWVGHHVEVKGVANLVRAFKLSLSRRPQLRLSLLGDGPGRIKIESLVADLGIRAFVEFLPATDRAGVARAICDHDFVVISSATETFSLVTLEALACGTPVLSTACGGPQDLITQPVLGQVVGNDIEGLTSGLLEMADRGCPGEADKLHAYVRERFSWDAIAGQLIEVYRDLSAS